MRLHIVMCSLGTRGLVGTDANGRITSCPCTCIVDTVPGCETRVPNFSLPPNERASMAFVAFCDSARVRARRGADARPPNDTSFYRIVLDERAVQKYRSTGSEPFVILRRAGCRGWLGL